MPSIYANQWRIRALKLKPEVLLSFNLNNVFIVSQKMPYRFPSVCFTPVVNYG